MMEKNKIKGTWAAEQPFGTERSQQTVDLTSSKYILRASKLPDFICFYNNNYNFTTLEKMAGGKKNKNM